MNKSDLEILENRVFELEKKCDEKQNKINDLEKKIEIMEGCESIAKSGIFKDPLQVYINTLMNVKDTEISVLRQKISELESKLSVKENLPKTKNGLCGEKLERYKYFSDFLPNDPLGVAHMLICAKRSYECNPEQKELTGMDVAYYHIFDTSDLRQIAEHLFVYCNHQKENGNE